MRRNDIGTVVLIVLLVLLLFGIVSLGDILNVIFYIVGGIILLGLVGALIFKIHLSRLRRKIEREGNDPTGSFRTYTWNFGGNRETRKKEREGEVTVKTSARSQKKVVNSNVGDYVDFEDIENDKKEAQ